MSKLQKYFVILAAITLCAAGLYYLSVHAEGIARNILPGVILAFLYMPAPLVSYIIVQKVSREAVDVKQFFDKKGFSLKSLGLTLGIFLSWILLIFTFTYFLGLLSPALFGSVITSVAGLKEHLIQLYGAALIANANMPPNMIAFVGLFLIGAIIAGFTINLFFALGEEIGWRGFLMKEFGHLPFIQRNLLIGAIWGTWHAPIILQGYNYGPTLALPGAFMFVIFCIGFAFAFGVIAEGTKNVVWSGALHGMFNGFAGSFIMLLTVYNPLVGGGIGLLAAVTWVIVAVVWYKLSEKAFV